MKKIICLVLGLLLASASAFAQTGTFPPNTVWGSLTGGQPKATPFSSFPGTFTDLNVSGYATFSGSVSVVIAADQNNWTPTGTGTYAHSTTVYVDGGAADRNITGLTGGVTGRIVTVVNYGLTNNIFLINRSASSSTGNKFVLGADAALPPGTSQALQYDGTVWRPNGSASSSIIYNVTPAFGFPSSNNILATGAGGSVVSAVGAQLSSLVQFGNTGLPIASNVLDNAFTINSPTNTTGFTVAGVLNTGANALPGVSQSCEWNTSGAPSCVLINVVNTASGANARPFEVQVDGVEVFGVDKSAGFAKIHIGANGLTISDGGAGGALISPGGINGIWARSGAGVQVSSPLYIGGTIATEATGFPMTRISATELQLGGSIDIGAGSAITTSGPGGAMTALAFTAPGASATVSVRKGDDSGACNLVFTGGLYTSTTC